MAIRTSDGIYLEVLQSAPVAGVPIEIDVYGGNNIATMLATLEGAQAPAFTDPFGDIGSGHFRIPTTDPKATGSIIRSGNYVKVKIAGVYRYAFFLENPRKVVASTESEAGEYWDLGGRGNIAYLERGSVYPPSWPSATGTTHEYSGVTAAFILDELLAAARDRGAIPQLTWDFTPTRDSDNAPWTDSLTMSVPAGLSLLDLWRQFVGMGYESEMTPDLRLRFWRDRSRDFTDSVIFRAGKHIRGEVTRDAQDAGLRTRMLVQGDGGRFFEVTDPVLEADAFIGRREGYLSFTASTDPTTLQQVGDNALAEVSLASDALSVPLHHGIGSGDYEPYADYRNGDWVALDIPGTYSLAKVRVRSLSVKAIPGGDYEVDADFNSVSLENIVRLKRIVDALGGGGSASGVIGSTSGSISSSGGAASGSTGRVAAEQGDTPGYLYDKIDPTGSVVPSLVGGVGARMVRLTGTPPALGALTNVDLTGLVDGYQLTWDAASSLWVPRAAGGGASWQDRIIARGSTANPADDEFSDGVLAAAWVDVGPAHSQVWTEAADVLSLLHASSSDTGGQGQFHAKLRPVPGGFAVGSAIEAGVRSLGSSGGYPMVGLMMTNGTAYSNATDYVYGATYSSGNTTQGRRNVTIRRGKFVTAESAATDPDLDATGDVGIHLRLKWAAVNTWELAISPDAVSWLTVASGIAYTMTPTHIGVAFTSWGIVGNRVATWDYFRVR